MATLLVVIKTVTLVLGALITSLAYRAFRRRKDPALRALMIGFGLVTLGSAAGGALYHFAEIEMLLGVSIESLATAAGFAVLVYSLYVGVDASDEHEGGPETETRTGTGTGTSGAKRHERGLG
jgi:small neutral amino acid transporter SnatA (MarC family)